MKTHADTSKIPLWVLPCAIGFFVVSLGVGSFLASVFALEPTGFLLRFSPLFTWAATFVLALYVGRRLPVQGEDPRFEDHGFLWWDRPTNRSEGNVRAGSSHR
jgi:hypothetical protein